MAEFETTLYRISLNKAAQSVWQSSSVKNKVKQIFFHMDKLGCRKKWKGLIKKVNRSLEKLSLPDNLYAEFAVVVKDTAWRIYDWFFYLRNIHLFDYVLTDELYDTYLREMYWTVIGTIDEVKTMKHFWLNNPDIDVFKLFQMACCFCSEELIDMLWEKLPKDVQSADYSRFYKKKSSHLTAYWISYKRSSLGDLLEKIKNCPERDWTYNYDTLDECFVQLAAVKRYHLAFKYFWSKISIQRQQEIAGDLYQNILDGFFNFKHIRHYKRDRDLETCVVLFNSMPEAARKYVFELEKSDTDSRINMYLYFFLHMLLSLYPWQEILICTIRQLQSYFNLCDYTAIFSAIFYLRATDADYLDVPLENSIIQKQTVFLWKILPSELKVPVAKKILYPLSGLFDIKILRLILNDECVVQEREKLLKQLNRKFIELTEEKKWEDIKKFVNELLILKKWEDDTTEKLKKIYYSILFEFEVEKAKLLLDSFEDEDDKKKVLDKIDHEILCYYLAKRNRIDVLQEYSKWVFPSEKELNDFKERIKSSKFTCYFILELWTAELEDWTYGQSLSYKFLEWIFNCCKEDIRNFKKTVLLQTLKDRWPDPSKDFKILSHFLYWCYCSAEEVEKIRKEYLDKHLPDKCVKLIKKGESSKAEGLLDLVFGSANKKDIDRFKSKFISSRKGLEAVEFFIGTVKSKEIDPSIKEELSEIFKNFINKWVKCAKTTSCVRSHLNKIYDKKISTYRRRTTAGVNNKNIMDLDFDELETIVLDIHKYREDPNGNFVVWDKGNYELFFKSLTEVCRNRQEAKQNESKNLKIVSSSESSI